jgi:hypothetical protein
MFRRKTSLDLIKNRQKLIKLADSSEAGWRVVDGYVSNSLAEDSDIRSSDVFLRNIICFNLISGFPHLYEHFLIVLKTI